MRDRRWIQAARVAFITFAFVFAASVTLQILIAGMALFVDSSRWEVHIDFARYFACIPLIMALLAWLAGLARKLMWRSIGLFGMVIGMFLTAVLSARIGWLSALHPVIAMLLFWGILEIIRGVRDPGLKFEN